MALGICVAFWVWFVVNTEVARRALRQSGGLGKPLLWPLTLSELTSLRVLSASDPLAWAVLVSFAAQAIVFAAICVGALISVVARG